MKKRLGGGVPLVHGRVGRAVLGFRDPMDLCRHRPRYVRAFETAMPTATRRMEWGRLQMEQSYWS